MAIQIDGKRMKELREARVLGRRELAKLAGVGYTTLYKMEAHDHRPRPETIRAVAKVLKTDPHRLLRQRATVA